MIGRQIESDPAGASQRYENPRDAYDYSIRQFGVGPYTDNGSARDL
jgi:hypothetical protein